MAVRWKQELAKQGGQALIANGIVWMKCPFNKKSLKPYAHLDGTRYPTWFRKNENYKHIIGVAKLNSVAGTRRSYAAVPENYPYSAKSSHLARAYLALADSVRMRLGLPLADDGKQCIKTDLVRDRVFLRHAFGLDPYFRQAAE